MDQLDKARVRDHIMTILHWSYNTAGQKQRLQKALDTWLDKNDDGLTLADKLANRFLVDVDIDEVVGEAERGKIYQVRSEFTPVGFFHVTIWRSNGNDNHYTLGGNAERIQNRLLKVAVMQDRLAEYAYEEISVRYIDLDDIARAWATGPRCRLSEIKRRAQQNFLEYVEEKTRAESPLPGKVEDFRVEISEVNND